LDYWSRERVQPVVVDVVVVVVGGSGKNKRNRQGIVDEELNNKKGEKKLVQPLHEDYRTEAG